MVQIARIIPWLEERRQFFTAQPPKFEDWEFRISPQHSFPLSSDQAVCVARRAGFVAVRSRGQTGVQTIVVTEDAWCRFMHGVLDHQFDSDMFIDHVVELASIDGEIGVRMVEHPGLMKLLGC